MKKWKIKEEGGMNFLFDNKPNYFDTQEEAMKYIKEHLPQGSILSQAVHYKLFERNGLFNWKHHGCYIRDTKYYTKGGKDLAEPLDEIVLACEHIKNQLDKCGKTCNQMLGIRASYLRGYCIKDCKLNPFVN